MSTLSPAPSSALVRGLASSAAVPAGLRAAGIEAIRTTRGGDTVGGMKLARRVYTQAKDSEDLHAELDALNVLAVCQAAHGAFIEAVATTIDATRLATRLDDRLGMAHALATLAGAAGFILDTLEISIRMLDRCVAVALEMNDVGLEVRARTIRGIMLGNLKRFEEGERDFAIAMEKIEASGELNSKALVAGNLASIASKRARAAPSDAREALWSLAEERTDAAAALARRDGNLDVESRCSHNMGDLYFQQNDWEAALAAYRKSLELSARARHKARLIDAYIEIGRIHAVCGRLQDGLDVYEAAFAAADTNRPTNQVAIACDRMADLYERLGNDSEALRLREKAERERAEFDRESEHTRRELAAFWRNFETGPA